MNEDGSLIFKIKKGKKVMYKNIKIWVKDWDERNFYIERIKQEKRRKWRLLMKRIEEV